MAFQLSFSRAVSPLATIFAIAGRPCVEQMEKELAGNRGILFPTNLIIRGGQCKGSLIEMWESLQNAPLRKSCALLLFA
jgi:hypothetical protein